MWHTIRSWFTRSDDQLRQHSLFRPDRDWLIMLVGFAILNGLIVLVAVYVFFQVQAGTFFARPEPGEAEAAARIEKQQLTNVIEHYEQKRSRFRSLRQGPPSTFDPSQ